MSLSKYIKDAMGLFNRNDVVKTSDLIKRMSESIEDINSLEPSILTLSKIDTKMLSDGRVRQATNYINMSGIKANNLKEGYKKIIQLNKDLIEGYKNLIDVIENDKAKYYTLDSLTPKQSAIIIYGQRLINAGSAINQLVMILVYSLQQDEMMYKKKSNDVINSLRANSIIIAGLNRRTIKSKIEHINKLSNDHIKDVKDLTVQDKTFIVRGKTNFTGNPIYHIRRWWEDRKHEEYERNKYERKLLSLKLAELQMLANSENAPLNIQEQVDYYEEEVAKYDRKIEEYRNA